jgi:fibronectin type 3 domain-containing protein/predicted  nucleic acid-binding Zn-ribbon protein
MREVSLSLQQLAKSNLRNPVQHVYLDFDRDGVYEVDVTSDVETMSVNHELQSGGGYKRGKPSVDQATVVLFNEDGRYSPHNASSPYNGNVVTGVGIKICAGFGNEEIPIFTGVVSAWNHSRDKNVTTVKCKDRAYYMQRKDAPNILEVSVPMRDAVITLIDWVFGEGNQDYDVDNIPIIIPVLEFNDETKVWNYIQMLSEACDARAYFDGLGKFHFHSALALDTDEPTVAHHFTTSSLFSLDEEFDQTEVRNRWKVESEYLSLHPEQIVWGTPEDETETVEEYTVGDTVKNAVDLANKSIQLKTKPEGETVYEDTWNVPIKTKNMHLYDELAVKVYNVTKSKPIPIDHFSSDADTGFIQLYPDADIEEGDLLSVTYVYLSRNLLAGKKRTWYADLEHRSYNVQPLEFAANNAFGKKVPISQYQLANNVSVIEYEQIKSDRMKITLQNDYNDTVYISTMQIKAQPILSSSPITAVCEDEDSIEEYGILEESFQNDFISSEDYLQKLSVYLCDMTKHPRSIVNAQIKGMPHLEIGDIIKVTEEITGIDYEFVITAIDDKWLSGSWDATLTLEQAIMVDWTYEEGRSTIVNKSGGKSALETNGEIAVPDIVSHQTFRDHGGKVRNVLTWEEIDDPRLSYYNVYCQFPDTLEFVYVGRTSGTEATFTHAGLDYGKTYNYQVTAVNNNEVESIRSMIYVGTAGEDNAPSVPQNQAAVGGSRHIRLSWDLVTTDDDETPTDDVVAYRIYTYSGETPSLLTVIPHPNTTFVHGGLNHGQTVIYAITAVDRNGNESEFPDEPIQATTELPALDDTTTPSTPSGISHSASFKSITLNWNNVTNVFVKHYELQYATKEGEGVWGSWTNCEGNAASNQYTHQPLDTDLSYKYRIRAVSGAGVASSWSSEYTAGKPLRISLSEDVVGELAESMLSEDTQEKINDAQSRLTEVEGRVTTTEASISTLEGEIELKASQSDLDAIEGRVTDTESELSLQAGEIELRATKTEVDAIEERVTEAEGALSVQAGQISAVVGRVDGHDTSIAALVVDAGEISSTVSSLEGTVAGHTSTIAQHATDISQRIMKNYEDEYGNIVSEVVTEINASPEGVKIAGNKIVLDGDTDVLGDFKVSGDAVFEGSFKAKGLGFLSLGHKASDEIGLKFWGNDDTGEYIFRAPESLGEFPDISVYTNSNQVHDEMEFDFFVPKGCIAMNFAVGYYGGGGADMLVGTEGWARILVENEERFYSTWSWYWDDNLGQFTGIQPSDATLSLNIPPEWGGTWKTMKFEVSATASSGNSAGTGLTIREVSVQFKLRMMGYESDFGLDAEEEEEE